MGESRSDGIRGMGLEPPWKNTSDNAFLKNSGTVPSTV